MNSHFSICYQNRHRSVKDVSNPFLFPMLSISDEIPSQASSGASAPRAAAAAQLLWAPPTQATAEACGAQDALAELQRGAARSLEESGLRTLRLGRNMEAFKVRSVGYKWKLISLY